MMSIEQAYTSELPKKIGGRKTHQYKTLPSREMTCTACPSDCSILWQCLSERPGRCVRDADDDDDCWNKASARPLDDDEACCSAGKGRRGDAEEDCPPPPPRRSGISFPISRLSSSCPSSSTRIFFSSSSASILPEDETRIKWQ